METPGLEYDQNILVLYAEFEWHWVVINAIIDITQNSTLISALLFIQIIGHESMHLKFERNLKHITLF